MEAGAEGRGLRKTDRMLAQQRYTRYMMQSEHTKVERTPGSGVHSVEETAGDSSEQCHWEDK